MIEISHPTPNRIVIRKIEEFIPEPKRSYKPWTTGEVERLRIWFPKLTTRGLVRSGMFPGRNEKSLEKAALRFGVKKSPAHLSKVGKASRKIGIEQAVRKTCKEMGSKLPKGGKIGRAHV